MYHFSSLAVIRPANATEVSEILKLANGENIPVVPMSGNPSLAGGTFAEGGTVLSLELVKKFVKSAARRALQLSKLVLFCLTSMQLLMNMA